MALVPSNVALFSSEVYLLKKRVTLAAIPADKASRLLHGVDRLNYQMLHCAFLECDPLKKRVR